MKISALLAWASHCYAWLARARHSKDRRVEPPLFRQQRTHEFVRRDAQCLGNHFDVVERDVSDALFEAADEGAIQSGLERQPFLGKADVNARHAHIPSKHHPKTCAGLLASVRPNHFTDGRDLMSLKRRCLNIIRCELLSNVVHCCAARRQQSCAQKRYANTSFGGAMNLVLRAAACAGATVSRYGWVIALSIGTVPAMGADLTGTMACGASLVQPPEPAFAVPASVQIQGNTLTWTREALGMREVVSAPIVHGVAALDGYGGSVSANTRQAFWDWRLQGKLTVGNDGVAGELQLLTKDGRTLQRRCNFATARPTVATPVPAIAAPTAPAAPPVVGPPTSAAPAMTPAPTAAASPVQPPAKADTTAREEELRQREEALARRERSVTRRERALAQPAKPNAVAPAPAPKAATAPPAPAPQPTAKPAAPAALGDI